MNVNLVKSITIWERTARQIDRNLIANLHVATAATAHAIHTIRIEYCFIVNCKYYTVTCICYCSANLRKLECKYLQWDSRKAIIVTMYSLYVYQYAKALDLDQREVAVAPNLQVTVDVPYYTDSTRDWLIPRRQVLNIKQQQKGIKIKLIMIEWKNIIFWMAPKLWQQKFALKTLYNSMNSLQMWIYIRNVVNLNASNTILLRR